MIGPLHVQARRCATVPILCQTRGTGRVPTERSRSRRSVMGTRIHQWSRESGDTGADGPIWFIPQRLKPRPGCCAPIVACLVQDSDLCRRGVHRPGIRVFRFESRRRYEGSPWDAYVPKGSLLSKFAMRGSPRDRPEPPRIPGRFKDWFTLRFVVV